MHPIPAYFAYPFRRQVVHILLAIIIVIGSFIPIIGIVPSTFAAIGMYFNIGL